MPPSHVSGITLMQAQHQTHVLPVQWLVSNLNQAVRPALQSFYFLPASYLPHGHRLSQTSLLQLAQLSANGCDLSSESKPNSSLWSFSAFHPVSLFIFTSVYNCTSIFPILAVEFYFFLFFFFFGGQPFYFLWKRVYSGLLPVF